MTRYYPELTTLCYIEQDDRYLMLHRIKKQNDLNKDKWLGVGGHFEYGESPDECLLREVSEETGLLLTSYTARGIVTFIYHKGNDKECEDNGESSSYSQGGDLIVEYMHLYTAEGFSGELKECDEGKLEWVDKDKVYKLPIWEGDKIFFRLLEEKRPFFSLKLVYAKDGRLTCAMLDGRKMK